MNTSISGVPVGAGDPVTLLVRDGRVAEIRPGGDAEVRLAPGLVDSHCHGAAGQDFLGGDGRVAAEYHHAAGSTTVVASLVSAPESELRSAMRGLSPLVADRTLAGVHLEGPFLAPARRGSHDPSALVDPDAGLVRRVMAEDDSMRMLTLAPELPGASEVIDLLLEQDVVVAFGHTDADATTMRSALGRVIAAGRSPVVTHLYNGMPSPHHRRPGPVMPALEAAAQEQAWVELIADGMHLAGDTLRATFALVGDRVVLVSDATPATGLGDGTFHLGSVAVVVSGTESRLVEGDSLAGSVSPLLRTVQEAIRVGVPPQAAFAAATRHPARAHGLDDVGTLTVGSHADVLVLDDDWSLLEVWRSGRALDS